MATIIKAFRGALKEVEQRTTPPAFLLRPRLWHPVLQERLSQDQKIQQIAADRFATTDTCKQLYRFGKDFCNGSIPPQGLKGRHVIIFHGTQQGEAWISQAQNNHPNYVVKARESKTGAIGSGIYFMINPNDVTEYFIPHEAAVQLIAAVSTEEDIRIDEVYRTLYIPAGKTVILAGIFDVIRPAERDQFKRPSLAEQVKIFYKAVQSSK